MKNVYIEKNLPGLIRGIEPTGHWGSKILVSRADPNPDGCQHRLVPLRTAVALDKPKELASRNVTSMKNSPKLMHPHILQVVTQ